MKRVAILGATGSVGQSTLRLLAERADAFEPVLLSANRSVEALIDLAASHGPRALCFAGLPSRRALPRGQETPRGVRVHFGAQGILDALAETDPDLVLNAITGAAGLRASAWTLEAGKSLLLANKESLVAAGSLLKALEARHGGRILPVDSEHAAIHQCLRGERREDVRRVWLTASGGPFRDLPPDDFLAITPAQALAHPTWKMGPRITIGSATLMNKAFEVIEAHHLFGLRADEIETVVHRQSIVHSIVEFRDGSLISQMGVPDMRVPILYCLGWPDRLDFEFDGFDFEAFRSLTFEPVDRERFPALDLGYHCLEAGGDSGAVLNAADEVASQAFLDGRIPFAGIPRIVEKTLESHSPNPVDSVAQVQDVDSRARAEAETWIQRWSA